MLAGCNHLRAILSHNKHTVAIKALPNLLQGKPNTWILGWAGFQPGGGGGR